MKRWQFWGGLAISAVFLWLVLRGLQPADVWEALREAEYWWLAPGIASYMVAVWARAWRWHYLLRPLKRIPLRVSFPIVAIGYMGNNIYPARAGEVLRAYVLRRQEGVSMSASLATIVIERAFDGIVMLGFVFLNLPELARVSADSGVVGDIRTLAILGAVGFLLAVLAFLLMAAFPTRAESMLGAMNERFVPDRFRPQARGLISRFLDGVAALRSPRDVLMVLITSVVIWLFETGKYWFVMHAFRFTLSFFALMLMNGVVNLMTTIPSAPGYLGTFDAPGIAVLVAYGVDHAMATGYTLVLHAALWLPITLLGAFYMARESLSWRRVQVEVAGEHEG